MCWSVLKIKPRNSSPRSIIPPLLVTLSLSHDRRCLATGCDSEVVSGERSNSAFVVPMTALGGELCLVCMVVPSLFSIFSRPVSKCGPESLHRAIMSINLDMKLPSRMAVLYMSVAKSFASLIGGLSKEMAATTCIPEVP